MTQDRQVPDCASHKDSSFGIHLGDPQGSNQRQHQGHPRQQSGQSWHKHRPADSSDCADRECLRSNDRQRPLPLHETNTLHRMTLTRVAHRAIAGEYKVPLCRYTRSRHHDQSRYHQKVSFGSLLAFLFRLDVDESNELCIRVFCAG